MDEESIFQSLHLVFSELSHSYKDKSILEITDIFMKVSGDIQSVKDYLAGRKVCEWNYLDDVALSMPETSNEFKLLLSEKGKDEIDRRKRFLLNASVGMGDLKPPQPDDKMDCS